MGIIDDISKEAHGLGEKAKDALSHKDELIAKAKERVGELKDEAAALADKAKHAISDEAAVLKDKAAHLMDRAPEVPKK